ncbi:MAG: MFS transporter, partial [Alphaproteobacteria bacterium]
PHSTLPGRSVGEAFRTGVFWRLLVAFFLISVVVGGFIVNLPAMLADRGTSPAQAAQALGLMGIAIIVGRLTVGALVDRFAVRVIAPLYILLPAASCLLLAGGDAAPVAIILVGLAAGAEVDLLAYLTGHLFGMRHYARIYGWGLAAFSAGAGVGPGFAGWVHDVSGSYVDALYAFAAMIAVASALLATLRPPEAC